MAEQGDERVPPIRGERVFLRAAERSDIALFVRWLNDAETMAYLGQRAPLSEPLEERWFDQMLDSQGKDRYLFTICRIDDGSPIGNTGLFAIDYVNGNAGIGIGIGEKRLWGQGYGTDAINALLDFGFGQLRLERMWLEVVDYNPRARRSYEKSGFALEGTKRRAMYKRGAYRDVLFMAILRDEWAALERRRSWDFDAAPA